MPLKNLQSKLDQLAPFKQKINNEWSFALAALLAFNLSTALIPLCLAILSAILLIFGNSNAVQTIIHERLDVAFPGKNFTDTFDDLYDTLSDKSGTLLAISLIIAFFTNFWLLISFDDVLTVIYRVRERSPKKRNIHALKMLVIFALLMTILLIALVWTSLINTRNQQGYYALAVVVSIIVTFLLFSLIYYFVPPQKMSWKNIWCGTLFLTIGLQILLQLFPLYVRHFMKYYIGQMGLVLIVLVLFYLWGLLFVIGAQINAYFFDHVPSLPHGLGNCLSQFGNPENMQLIDRPLHSPDSATSLVSGLYLDY